MPFLTSLDARYTEGRNKWALFSPLVYETWAGEEIVVPWGFVTDLASIPFLARAIVPHNGAERMPAVIHDYLFVIQDRSLSETNRIMREAMIDTGVSWYSRTMINAGLAIGSWVAWRRNARALKEAPDVFLGEYGLARR